MLINLLIKERLQGYFQLIRDINNYKCDNCSDDDNVITWSDGKAVLQYTTCCKKLKERLTQRSCGKKEMEVKRNGSGNVSCFGQRCL